MKASWLKATTIQENNLLLPSLRAKRSNPVLEIAELVPSVSEESHSEFASATPRNRYAPRNDKEKR